MKAAVCVLNAVLPLRGSASRRLRAQPWHSVSTRTAEPICAQHTEIRQLYVSRVLGCRWASNLDEDLLQSYHWDSHTLLATAITTTSGLRTDARAPLVALTRKPEVHHDVEHDQVVYVAELAPFGNLILPSAMTLQSQSCLKHVREKHPLSSPGRRAGMF